MLTDLYIENIALVERLKLSFDRGMTVLTGETGAGKSVIVNALALVLGSRAEREYIRHGADRAVVEATFDLSRLPGKYKAEMATYAEGDRLVIRRDIQRNGSSKVRVNEVSIPLAKLRELTAPLAEILGQHANQMLLDEHNHLLFLDSFAGVLPLRDEVGQLYDNWQHKAKELARVLRERDQRQKEHELLQFQRDEIIAADIRVGEEDELQRERKILDSSRALMQSAALIQEMMDGEEQSLLALLRTVRKELDSMVAIDEHLRETADELAEVDYRLEDFRAYIEKYGGSIPDDPERLEAINQRLDEIYQLKRKYGGSEESILRTLAEVEQKLAENPDIDALIATLEEATQQAGNAYAEKATALSAVRTKAAEYLQRLVVKELAELAIDNGGFVCELSRQEVADGIELDGKTVQAGPEGLENARFLFSANPGEPLKSLVKTASGGEISRVLLALKSAEKKNNRRSHTLM
ncbi:MAG: hypothetical protein D6800_02830, partial [Candidatus Zixiibacteriota bacterium]